MKVIKEERAYNDEERLMIQGCTELLEIHKKIQKHNVKVQIRVNEYWKHLNIEITNNAPILTRDLERIHAKRNEFKAYADKGEEMNFFIKNMDDSDGGAGLGYATIDSGLRDMGMDPFKVISIISITNTTIMFGFELDALKRLAEKEASASSS